MASRSINDPHSLTFYFNDQEVRAEVGQSVAAALINIGERTTRTTRIHSQPRGVFCGIGICFDCLIIIDGVENQRACVTLVTQGMRVEMQDGPGTQPNGDLP